MKRIHTVGLDTSKYTFQVHGADKEGGAIAKRKLQRSQVLPYFRKLKPCLVGIEVTGGAHHLARKLMAMGHMVKLMPAAYVKPYVKTNKNDEIDAEAICEAVRRPNMRFVPVKTEEQQAALSLHRARTLLIRQRIQLTNAIRGLLAEYGMVRDRGRTGGKDVVQLASNPTFLEIPQSAKATLAIFGKHAQTIDAQIKEVTSRIKAWHRNNPDSLRLETIPGIGELAASALVATIGDGSNFKNGRELAAWIGLVPRQRSSGGKTVLGHIPKHRNRYLKQLLYLGAKVLMLKKPKYPMVGWALKKARKKNYRVAIIALANRMARIVWALLKHKEDFRPSANTQPCDA